MKTTCYLQIKPEWAYYDKERLSGAKVARVTAKKPTTPLGGSIVVKMTLDIDDAAFKPLQPSIAVRIPVEHTEAVTVESEPLEVPG